MQHSFLSLTISMLFWYNSHLSPLLTNICDCHSSFDFRYNCIYHILLILVTFAGLNICKIKLSEKSFIPIAFCFLCFKMCVPLMGIFFLPFFISSASGSCIAGEQFSCFIQLYLGGDSQMSALLEYFSILSLYFRLYFNLVYTFIVLLQFFDAFMFSSAYLFSTSLLFQLTSVP